MRKESIVDLKVLKKQIEDDAKSGGRLLIRQALTFRVAEVFLTKMSNRVRISWITDSTLVDVASLPSASGEELTQFFHAKADIEPDNEDDDLEGMAEIQLGARKIPVHVATTWNRSGSETLLSLLHPERATLSIDPDTLVPKYESFDRFNSMKTIGLAA